jgi:glycine oxidase
MVDFIIVGSGLAGIAFADTALLHGKSIVVFDNASQTSSKVAAGLYNPVILKRFTAIYQAQHQLDVMEEFYRRVESRLEAQLIYPMPTLRKFFSAEEQNNWFAASDKPGLSDFLSTRIISRNYAGIESPFGYGEVLQTGYVNTSLLVRLYKEFLSSTDSLISTQFDHSKLSISPDRIQYEGVSARRIVFAEGFGMHSNPLFNYLPLDGTKGELLVIKAPGLGLDVIVNTNVFILPLGDGLFKVGATYNWTDKTEAPTHEGQLELIARIREIITCDFEIVEHLAGVRPTVKDRKPLIGTHHLHKNVHLLNGLGTRGVMLGPAMAAELFEHIETGNALPKEIDIKRFTSS